MTTGRLCAIAYILAAGILAAGCAAPQTQALRQALETYSAAEKDPTITQKASVTLYEARQALNRAEKANNREEQRHFSYLAQKKTELARIQARRLQFQQELERLEEKQDQYLAALRRRQIEHARRQAEQAQQELKARLDEERQQGYEQAE